MVAFIKNFVNIVFVAYLKEGLTWMDGIKDLEKMLKLTKQKIKLYRKIPGTEYKLKILQSYCKILNDFIKKHK